MKAANLGVLFLIELGALAAVAYWGFTLDVAAPLAWSAGLGAPAVLVVLWALFGSQKARYKTRGAVRVGFELVWFGCGAVALALAGAWGWAVSFAVVCLLSKTLAVVRGQQDGPSGGGTDRGDPGEGFVRIPVGPPDR